MDYLGKKLNTLTGEALSGMADQMRRTATKRRESDPRQQQKQVAAIQETLTRTTVKGSDLHGDRSDGNYIYYPNIGIPFGGDTRTDESARPPPIGFNFGQPEPKLVSSPIEGTASQQKEAIQAPGRSQLEATSSESLYEGDAWTRLWFQRVMILSLLRLLIFMRKVYEDYHATKLYSLTGQTGHLLTAGATLLLPTVVFTIYRVTRYLQLALPQVDLKKLGELSRSLEAADAPKKAATSDYPDEEAQLRRALMSSPTIASGPSSPQSQLLEEDRLVTARQTPTQLDEQFHDSQSDQLEVAAVKSSSPLPSNAIAKAEEPTARQQKEELEFKEHVNIDKLGNLPDKETTRIVIGASEQLLHGVLFIFWQLKRQVDVLGYLVERSCLWRRPKQTELEQLGKLRTGSDGLEWFQDFYAAFLAILAQVYTLGLYWSSAKPADGPTLKTTAAQLNAGGGSSFSGLVQAESPDGAISNSARALSQALSQQALAGTLVHGQDLLILSELIVSSAVVFSLLIAVRRRDDGPLTLGLSILGWGSLFAARIIVIALAFVHVGWRIMLPLVVLHILGITGWIYRIALDSHNEKASESEESQWDDVDLGAQNEQNVEQGLELKPEESKTQAPKLAITNYWSYTQHVILLAQILTLFSIPSLFYWPIMFNLKLQLRPLKYLVLILSENFLLIPAIWFSISQSDATAGQWYLLGAVGAFSIMGFLFTYLYICCKPNLTEYFARADELFNEAETSGVYYEFCARVFKLPDLSKQTFRRLMNQSEVIEEIEIVEDLPTGRN